MEHEKIIFHLDRFIACLGEEYKTKRIEKNLPELRKINDTLISAYRIKVEIQLGSIN